MNLAGRALELLTSYTLLQQRSFVDVVADVTLVDGSRFDVSVPGTCFSEFKSGPNLGHLCAAVVEMLAGEHPRDTIRGVGLKSCRALGFGPICESCGANSERRTFRRSSSNCDICVEDLEDQAQPWRDAER